jgi:exosortase/archaeosortase family protein
MKKQSFGKDAFFFLLKFFAIYAVFQLLILNAPLHGLESWIASLQAHALSLESAGNQVLFQGHTFEIVPNCTGLMGVSVLASIVFSLRKPAFGKKALLFAFGAAALFPLNLARVWFVLWAAIEFGPGLAETIHIATWFFSAGLIIGLWYFLTKKVAGVRDFGSLF